MRRCVAWFVVAFAAGCSPQVTAPSQIPVYCVTIPPLAAFIAPVVDGRAQVHVLLPPGASPHTYELRPADARAAATSRALIYVDDSLDAWASHLQAPERLKMSLLVPPDKLRRFDEASASNVHSHSPIDPHIWLDPVLMRATLPKLVDALCDLDPEGAETYRENAERFDGELQHLNEALANLLSPLKGRSVIQFHPSLNYFLARYSIRSAAVIERIAGQEPSPRQIKELADLAASEGVEVIITEPQLPDAPVRALAEATGARVALMDPLGGVPGRMTYEELLRYNAVALLEAFE